MKLNETEFEADQIEEIKAMLEDQRLEVAQSIIKFIVEVPILGKSASNQKATQARIASRVALLDRLLNKRELRARDIPSVYGVSIHQYYDTLEEVEAQLEDSNSKIREIIRIK